MVGHFAYMRLSLGEDCDPENAIATLVQMWAGSIGLADGERGQKGKGDDRVARPYVVEAGSGTPVARQVQG